MFIFKLKLQDRRSRCLASQIEKTPACSDFFEGRACTLLYVKSLDAFYSFQTVECFKVKRRKTDRNKQMSELYYLPTACVHLPTCGDKSCMCVVMENWPGKYTKIRYSYGTETL